MDLLLIEKLIIGLAVVGSAGGWMQGSRFRPSEPMRKDGSDLIALRPIFKKTIKKEEKYYVYIYKLKIRY